MNAVRKIDQVLMRLLTYSFFYPDLDQRPQARIAALSSLIAVEITLFAVTLPSNLLSVGALIFWLVALYEWRLWYRLRT